MPNLPAAEVIISLRDFSDSVGRVSLYVADGTTIAAARAATQSLLGPLSALTGCAIIGYSVIYSTHLSDARGEGPQPKAYRAIFVWVCDLEGKRAVTYLPGIKAALIDPQTQEVQQPLISDLISAVISGPFVNPFGYSIETLEAAFLQIDP